MRKINIFLILIGLMTSITGCTGRNIVNPGPQTVAVEEPEFTTFDGMLDMEQLHEDVTDIIMDTETYPMAQEMYFELDIENSRMYIDAVVKNDTSEDDSLFYLDEAIKMINDCAAMQNSEYKISSGKSFGGLFDTITIYLRLFYSEDYPDGEAILQDVIPAGRYMSYGRNRE